MNKNVFEKYINEQFKDVPLEKLEYELTKMRQIWLPQILEKKLKNQIKCKSCKKYSRKKDFRSETQKEITTETTYSDVGYGDDDKIGEVEYLVIYRICPICGNKEVQQKNFIRIIREWNRCE